MAKVIFKRELGSIQPYLTGLMHCKRVNCVARATAHARSVDDVLAVIRGDELTNIQN
jgi:hypothetical protein